MNINNTDDYQFGYTKLIQVTDKPNPVCNFHEKGFVRNLTTGEEQYLDPKITELILETVQFFNDSENVRKYGRDFLERIEKMSKEDYNE